MIGFLRAILNAAISILDGQALAAEQAAANLAAIAARQDLAAIQAAQLSAAIEHLRALVEDDGVIAVVGRPTFTSQE